MRFLLGDCEQDIRAGGVRVAPLVPAERKALVEALRGSPHSPKRTAATPRRIYEVRLQETGPFEILDPGGRDGLALVRAAEGTAAEAILPRLLEALRAQAYALLRADMAPPPQPRPWHWEALAGFLGDHLAQPGLAAERQAVLERLLERARRADAARIARALLPALPALPPESFAGIRTLEPIALGVLPLAARAAHGDRDALRELLVLELEYPAERELFCRVFTLLVPPDRNPQLYPEPAVDCAALEGPLAAIARLRERFDSARFEKGHGWIAGE